MVFSLVLLAAGAASGAAPQPKPYWNECAKVMETTVSGAVANQLLDSPDDAILVQGMDHATSCTNEALQLPHELRVTYQEMLLSFMAALENKTPDAVNKFTEAHEKFSSAVASSDLPSSAPSPTFDHEELIRAAKTAVERDLRDPMSAQYRDIRVVPGQVDIVCGEVNAKNAYGGYVGFRRFVATTDTVILEDASAQHALRDAQDGVFTSLCR